ncbi:MAG: type II toxin-antitoxin system Phd/YefM family antitoxin [Candidatus Wallbacteria bacterium]|nr:type II toxin-antitoxin system Phd/YefM family antitoxin [Candidatus Wallbacteria bacterium]
MLPKNSKSDYIIDDKGRKKGVILDMKKYQALIELIEDLEDTRDLLEAELEAREFTPYETFRKTWLKK